jgi:hypothetical protein
MEHEGRCGLPDYYPYTYYVIGGRASRWPLRALVVGIPLAVALGLALVVGAMVLYVNAISE